MQHFIAAGFAGLERMLLKDQGGSYCVGDIVSLAGICLVPQVYNARRWGEDHADFLRIAAIDAELGAIPAFAAAHLDSVRPGP